MTGQTNPPPSEDIPDPDDEGDVTYDAREEDRLLHPPRDERSARDDRWDRWGD